MSLEEGMKRNEGKFGKDLVMDDFLGREVEGIGIEEGEQEEEKEEAEDAEGKTIAPGPSGLRSGIDPRHRLMLVVDLPDADSSAGAGRAIG